MRLNLSLPARLVVMNLFLALAYFLLAKAGLLLALPPGYVTLVYPPAGLAFAACLIWGGRRVTLGIVLGSFASNATVGGHWHPDLLAFVIAAGSSLQALLGAMVLRRFDTQAEFGHGRTLGKFVLVAASTCLLAATVGNIALAASGLIHWGQLPLSFVSWWLGDTLGVLIILPLVMAFFDSRSLWKRRRIQVGVPLLAAILLCALVFLVVSADETRRLNSEFSAQADSLLTELRSLGESNSKAVKILAALTAQEENRTPQRFAHNVASLRQAFPLLQSLNWLPFVRQESLVAFERSQSKQLGIPFAVKPVPGHSFSDSGWLAPVTLIEPMAGNEAALGRDLLSEPVRAQAIEKARATGQVTTTGKIVLVQDRDGPGGLLILIPVLERGEVSGVVAGVVNLRLLLQPLMAAKDIRWSLRDLSAATQVHETLTDLPAFTQDSHFDAQGIYIRRTFQVADREWQIVLFKPYMAFKAAPISVASLVLFMALATCAGLVLFMLNISAQSEQVERLVDERTRQLREESERRGVSETRLVDAQAVAKVGSWETGLSNLEVIWSAQTYKLFDLDPNTFQATHAAFLEFVHPDDRAQVDAAFAKSFDSDSENAIEHRIVTASGTIKHVEERWRIVRDEQGKLIRAVGTCQDITERIHAQKAAHALAERLALAARAGGIGIWDYDVVSNALVWDDAMYTLYGISADQFGGAYEAWQAGVHPDDRARGDAEIQAALGGDKAFDTAFRILWPSGEVRSIRAIASVQRDDQGKPLRMVGTNWDITEQKLTEQTLQSSVKEKSALIKEVHHRVKNNLQVITSLLRLEAGRSLVADTKEVLAYMRGRIRTMSQLHESLYRSGTFASVDLGGYLSQVATQAFKAQELYRDSVRLTLNLGSVQAGMDQATAAGLLLNELISNCLKHGFPEGQAGEMSVELQPANDQDKPADGRWCLRVSDTGVGLSPDFEDKRKASLGLQLVTDMNHQLDGTLVIDSVPGAGARFSVEFTVQAPAVLVMPP